MDDHIGSEIEISVRRNLIENMAYMTCASLYEITLESYRGQ